MERVITFEDGKTMVLNNRVKWYEIYRSQFNSDVSSVYGVVVSALLEIFEPIMKQMGEEELTFDVIKSAPTDYLQMAVLQLTGIGVTDIMRMCWSMARAASDETKPYDIWVEEWDTFPLDVVIPELLTLIGEGSISTKNWQSLRPTEAKR